LFNFKALSFSSPDLKIFCKRFGLCVFRNQTHRQRNIQESKEQRNIQESKEQPHRIGKATEETEQISEDVERLQANRQCARMATMIKGLVKPCIVKATDSFLVLNAASLN
jgi:hypothetical protein